MSVTSVGVTRRWVEASGGWSVVAVVEFVRAAEALDAGEAVRFSLRYAYICSSTITVSGAAALEPLVRSTLFSTVTNT